MQKKRINARFSLYKSINIHVFLSFWEGLAKDLAKDFDVFAFIFKGLKWEFYQVHLLSHKLVGEVRIYSSN